MNIKYITYLFSGLLLSFLSLSCSDDDTTTTYNSASKDAQIYSFGFSAIAPISADSVLRAQDSIRFIQVNKTKFAIDQVAGVIYNPDSLPFGTVLDMAAMSITFNPSYPPSLVTITTPDSIKGYNWNSTDSVSLKKQPINFTIKAADGITTKRYDIDIRIHKIDPDTLLWSQMTPYPSEFGGSKTVLNKNKFYTFAVNGAIPVLYTSDKDIISWTKQTLSGLPATVKPQSVFVKNDVFFAVDQLGASYSSVDGLVWTKLTNGKTITSILGIVPAVNGTDNQLLVVYNSAGKYYFGKTKDLITVEDAYSINNELPDNFPLQNAASFTNESADKNSRMLILTGGLNSIGDELALTWLVKDAGGVLEISSFIKNAQFKGAGLSTFMYGNKFYALSSNQFYISSVLGEAWTIAPNKQKLDSQISVRTGQSVIVDTDNYIWIFGGVSKSNKGVTDVWKGRLNRLIP